MIYKYFLYKKLSLILLTFSLSTIFIFSQNGDDEFTKVDFYKSFSTPTECFKISHNNPSGPIFLLTNIQYNLFLPTTGKILKRVNRKYELKRVDGYCSGYPAIKILDKKLAESSLVIRLSLFYNDEETIAIFSYQFYANFNKSSYMVIDSNNAFGLDVMFSDSADYSSIEYKPESLDLQNYLRSVPKYNGFICVITQNNLRMILWPEYLSKDRGLIIRMKIEYIQNGLVIFEQYYSAFECYQSYDIKIEPTYLIYEGYEVKIHTSLLYWKFDGSISEAYLFNTKFSNIHLWNIREKNDLPSYGLKLFCLRTHEAHFRCPNKDKSILLISESNYFYHSTTDKMVYLSGGATRKKRVSNFLTSPCS